MRFLVLLILIGFKLSLFAQVSDIAKFAKDLTLGNINYLNHEMRIKKCGSYSNNWDITLFLCLSSNNAHG